MVLFSIRKLAKENKLTKAEIIHINVVHINVA
ncbi:MAG: hypothetical protein ACI9VN_001360 [Patescibacteria group bacterium]